jgi:transcriptional regulator with XRE-family HTH domain
MITGEQVRAARALLDWSLADLAEKSGIGQQAISKFENRETEPMSKTVQKLQKVLEDAGIEFLATGGVQPRQDVIRSYKGRAGFIEFIYDVYQTAKSGQGEICVSNVNEADFEYWLGDEDAAYVEKMDKLKNINFRILSKHGDMNVSSSYAEYRWVPEEQFSAAPFYVYGDKFAMILFEKDVTVFVVKNSSIADAQRKQFDIAWDKAEIPVLKRKK